MADLSPTAIQTILGRLLTNEDDFYKWWHILSKDFFDDEYYRRVYEFITEYKEKYGKPPDISTVIDYYTTEPSLDAERDMFIRVLDDIITAPVEDWPHYRDQMCVLARRAAFSKALEDAEEYVEDGDFESVMKAFSDANTVAVSQHRGTEGYFLPASIEERFDRRTDPTATVKRIAVQMGNLDSHLRGGLPPKTLTVFVGTTGAGKSTALVHVGRAAVLQGQRVLHVTLELMQEHVTDMYDSCFTGIARSDLERDAGKVRKKFLDAFTKYGDALRIIEFPEYSLTPEDLTSLIELFKREGKFYPDILLVDYADLMVGGGRFKKGTGEHRRLELNYIYTMLHRIAKEHDIVVATATQANRGAMDKKVVSLQDVAEDISKTWIADHVLAISQQEKERLDGRCRLFIAKNRSGRAFTEVSFKQDLPTCTFAIPSPLNSSRDVNPRELGKKATDDDDDET